MSWPDNRLFCDGGALYRCDGFDDDPDYVTYLGQCPECGGVGCDWLHALEESFRYDPQGPGPNPDEGVGL